MATARQRAEWLRVGMMTAWIVNTQGKVVNKTISPFAIIPKPYHPPPDPPRQKTPEEIESDNRLAWKVMDRYFSQVR